MRFLVLEDEATTARKLQTELEPLGHSVSLVPNVSAAQVALQAESLDVAVLSARLLSEASYSLVDYIRITQPELRIILVKDTEREDASARASDWVLSPPVSPLEVVQVMEYLMDWGAQEIAPRDRRAFTYAGAPRPSAGTRYWLN